MLRSVFLCLFILQAAGPVVQAQVVRVYDILQRPPGLTYRVLSAGPYEIIFQDGHRSQADEILWALQTTFPETDRLVGDGTPPHLTVVLNAFNDRGNGYVTSMPFKSEIESTALMGRGLSLGHGSWTRLVTAHELVHAVQADAQHGAGLTSIIRPFSADFSRLMNMIAPSGWIEGLAVYRESQLTPGAGRLNHPYFTMQFRAGMDAGNGWSLAQMLESPKYHRPFNRFYLGGALFTRFFVETYGPDAVQRVLTWQSRLPILGFGTNLRLSTGDWPDAVHDRFRVWYDSTYVQVVDDSQSAPHLLQRGRTGQVHRGPKWLTSTSLVTYAFAYDRPRGFYTLDVSTGDFRRWSMQESTEDAAYYVTNDGDVLFSRYERDRVSPITYESTSFRLRNGTHTVLRLPGASHTLNPVETADGRLLAVRQRGAFSDVVSLATDSIRTVVSMPRLRIESIVPHPRADSVAVIANAAGHQALFLADEKGALQPWIGFEGGHVYDASWSRSGEYVAFTADPTGTLQVYAVHTPTEEIRRLTNAPYAAMEPDISPDGSRIAYVTYADQRFDLVVDSLAWDDGVPVNRDDANFTWLTDWETRSTVSDVPEWDTADTPYRPLSHVRPRMVYPTAYYDSGAEREADTELGVGIGIGIQGSDPLQIFSYWGEGILQKGRLWGQIGVSTSLWGVIPTVQASRQPDAVQAVIQDSPTTTRTVRSLRDRSSMSFGFLVPRTFEQNVAVTSGTVSLLMSWRRDRFLDDALEPITSEFSRWAFTPAVQYGWRVQRNPRDVMPRTGTVVRWIGEFDMQAERFTKRRAWISRVDQYIPLASRWNTGIRLTGGLLHQNTSSVFNLSGFRPRGWEQAFVGSGDFIRYGMEVRQPVAFVDDGSILFPAILNAVYLYSWAERLHDTRAWDEHLGSAGIGAAIQMRFIHVLDVEFRWQWSYRFEDRTWVRDFSVIDDLP